MTSYLLLPPSGFHHSAPPLIDHSDLEKPLTLRLDEPASIHVRVSGIPRPSVRWQVGRRRVKESARFHLDSDGGQGHTLRISKVTRDLEQGVWVVATNVYGEDCSCVEVRTLEAVKRRAFKNEKNITKRSNSLSSEIKGIGENSGTNLVSVKTNSIASLKDWKDEMVVRNSMRSVDDLVFSSDKASLMSGLGYSLSVNTAIDYEDRDSTERLQSKRRRSRPLPSPLASASAATGLVFHEVEPRRYRPNPRFRSPAEKEEPVEEPEIARSPGTERSKPLLESAVETVKYKASEYSSEVQDRGNGIKVEKKPRKKKKRDESTENSTPTTVVIPEDTVTIGDGGKGDEGRGDNGYERNSTSDNLSSEVDGTWVLCGENLSDFCQEVFERFPRVETRDNANVGLHSRGKSNLHSPGTEISQSLGILLCVDRGKTAASKFGVLRDASATGKHNDKKIGTNSTQKEIQNSGKTLDDHRFAAEPSRQLTAESGNVLQNDSEKIKKKLNHQNSPSLAENISKVGAELDLVYSMESSLLNSKNDVKYQIKSKKRVVQNTKSLASVDMNVDKQPAKYDSNKSEGIVEVSRKFPIDSKELEQEHVTENQERKTLRRVNTKEMATNVKTNHSGTVKPGKIMDSRNISDVDNKEQVSGPAAEMPIISEKLADDMESASKPRRKKFENTKTSKRAPVIINHVVSVVEEFADEMEDEEIERTSTEKIMKKPGKPTPKSKEIPLAATASNSESFTESRKSEDFNGNPLKKTDKPNKRKVENKRRSAKSKSDYEKISSDETREMNYLENETPFANTPTGYILDYCNNPDRLRSITTSSRDRNDGSSKVTCCDDLEKSSGNSQNTDDKRRPTVNNAVETCADASLVKVKDKTENKKKATKSRCENKTNQNSSFHSDSRLEFSNSLMPTTPGLPGEQSEMPVNAQSKLENLPEESGPVLHAHETLFLKSLVRKLHSGQIEIIVVDKNKNAKSNQNESNAAQSVATTSNLDTLLNLFGASGVDKMAPNPEEREEISGEVGENFEDLQIENESKDREKHNIGADSILPITFSEQTVCSEGEVLRSENPVPKPRIFSMKMTELKRETLVDKCSEIQTVPDKDLQAKYTDITKIADTVCGPNVVSNVMETQLAKCGLHPPELNATFNVSEVNDKSHGSESSEPKLEPDKNLSSVDRTSKENFKHPKSKKPKEIHSGKSKSSRNQHSITSLSNDVIAKETSLPEVRTVQSRPADNSSLDDHVCKLNGKMDSKQSVVDSTNHAGPKTPRQKLIKAYNPVYPNYCFANGSRSDNVRDVGIIQRPGNYFSELLPNSEDKTRNKIARNFPTSADQCFAKSNKEYSTKGEQILGENSTVAEYPKNKRPLNVVPTHSKEKDFNSKLFNNSISDSITDESSVKVIGPVEPRETNLGSKSAKNALINNQSILFIDDSADDLESRDFDKQRRYRSGNGPYKGVVRGRRK